MQMVSIILDVKWLRVNNVLFVENVVIKIETKDLDKQTNNK